MSSLLVTGVLAGDLALAGDLGRRVVMLGDGLYCMEGLGGEEGPAPPQSIASSEV